MNTDIQTYNPESQRLALLAQYNPSEHISKWTAFNKKTNLTELVQFYPANWRLYELNLKYPTAKFNIDIIHMDIERDFVIVRAQLFIGDSYDTAPRRAVAHKQGKLTQLDKVETQAKARAARDLGISTELALDIDDGQVVGQVIESATIVNEVANESPTTNDATNESPRQLEPANVKPMKPKTVKAAQPAPGDSKLLPGQFNALKSLYLRLNQDLPPDLDNWTFAQAAATITWLQAQLKQAS